MGFDIPKGIGLWKSGCHTHNSEQVIVPDLVLGKGPTQSTSVQLNGSSTGGISCSRATGVSGWVFQPFDRYDKPCKT